MKAVPPAGSGRTWEAAAAKYLLDRGVEILEHGYRCRLGELDIVALDGRILVVVEVRARASTARGSAVETVDVRKQRKIVQATRHFLMHHPAWFERALRFDVIAVDGIDTDRPQWRWIKGAFDSS